MASVGRVNGTFCFTGASYRALFLKGRFSSYPGILFLSSKTFLRIISSVIFNSIHDQLVDKMNYIEFTGLKAFTSEFKLHTNPIKAFNGTCVRLMSITFPVIWSSVLISVTREWRC